MTVLKLARFADPEDDVLRNLEDAAFLRERRIDDEKVLDFSGVEDVTVEYLEELLQDVSIASLLDRLEGMNVNVEGAVEEWLERQQDDGGRSSNPRRPKRHRPSKDADYPVFEETEEPGQHYTPTRLVARLKSRLRSYIESAYPLKEPSLITARRELLEGANEGKLLAQEPFVETTPRYKFADGGYHDLGIEGSLADFLDGIAAETGRLYSNLYMHQAQALRAAMGERQDVIVATGTGSGKTECFLIPILGDLFQEARSRPKSFNDRAVRSLILYPMNALVNDQISRLRLLVGDQRVASMFREQAGHRRHPLFGMYTSRTQYPGPRDKEKNKYRVKPLVEYFLQMDDDTRRELEKRGRYPAKDLKAFYANGRNRENKYRTSAGDRELMTRQEMVRDGSGQGGSPDILVTNYSMLEYMLMRPYERPIFQETREWLQKDGNVFRLVLDEAHLYRGARGAEVSFLIRRLLGRLGIEGQADKYQVILTSATLGDSDEARERVRRFGADLVGKTPDDFELVTGTLVERESQPEPEGSDDTFVELLRELDLEALHEAESAAEMSRVLRPVLDHFDCAIEEFEGAEEEVRQGELFEALYAALEGQPLVNKIHESTAGNAIAHEELAETLFPEVDEGERVTDALLTLAALARRRPGQEEEAKPLLPTRMHVMFRGLPGLYACLNPTCSGRQAEEGQRASVGKLFTRARTHCDACGARALELASCRDCGSTYFHAYAKDYELEELNYLWGEVEGRLRKVTLATEEPRTGGYSEEIRVHTQTGFVDWRRQYPADEVRRLWLALDKKNGERDVEFRRCLQCRPHTPQATNRITNFRTRGAQPFTALIDTQFAEQPPQDKAEGVERSGSLPNRGRKVLIFSDGRQKAARLAPALETAHRRDTFRQVLALAIRSLKDNDDTPFLSNLYPAVVEICQEEGVSLLDSTEFRRQLKMARNSSAKELQSMNVQPPQEYASLLYDEFTDSFYSLIALGLGEVRESSAMEYVFDDLPADGLEEAEQKAIFRMWLRHMMEERHFLPRGVSPGYLGDEYSYPKGLSDAKGDRALSNRMRRFLENLKGESWAEAVDDWLWEEVIRGGGFCRFVNDKYYLSERAIVIDNRLEGPWYRCDSCSTLWAQQVAATCPNCLGELFETDDDGFYVQARAGFYRKQVTRALNGEGLEPFGLTAEEHSAQLTGMNQDEAFEKTEQYELRFQDLLIDEAGPIDVLSCTTTMEVGIDIGSLSAVAMHNVPPHVSNYQQRAGRAGRRGTSVASVVTYAHGGSHDAHYYSNPAEIISGDVRTPVVYIENPDILERHINAYLVQRFFHANVAADDDRMELFKSLGKVGDFLSPERACSFESLRDWLRTHEPELKAEIKEWAPSFSHWLDEDVDVTDRIESAVSTLLNQLKANLPFERLEKKDELSGLEMGALERQLDESLLQTLIDKAVLPRYAFPTDVVSFWVTKEPRRTESGNIMVKTEYQPQRQLQIALSEYAPGSTLTIDKKRFTSAALYSPYLASVHEVVEDAHSYVSCEECGYVSMSESAESLSSCPTCGAQDLARRPFVVPPGFAPNANDRVEKDAGGTSRYAGWASPARIEVQEIEGWEREAREGRLQTISQSRDLVVVNKGIGDRGFFICPECGSAEPVAGEGYPRPRMFDGDRPVEHKHPVLNQDCFGKPDGPFFLGHQFPTDVFLMRVHFESPVRCSVASAAGRSALTSLAQAMSQAATRVMQIDEGELEANWSPVQGNEQAADVYVYDTLPGGAGYARSFGEPENLELVFEETRRLLSGCDCEGSCYDCLRHYGNRFMHGALDRRLALGLLDYIVNGDVPSLDFEQKLSALAPLSEVLASRQVEADLEQRVSCGDELIDVPLVAETGTGGEVWVDVRHPLIHPDEYDSEVVQEAELTMQPCSVVDSYTLEHDLPEAVERITNG